MSEAAPQLPGSPLRVGGGAVKRRFEEIPRRSRTAAELWAAALRDHGARPFIEFEDGTAFTYREFDARIARWQRLLADRGLGEDERFATLLPNGVEAVATFLAAVCTNHTIVPINTNAIGESLRHALADSQAGVLVTTREWGDRIDDDWKRAHLQEVIFVEDLGEALLDRGTVIHQAQPSDSVAVLYTSGTTGPPKGAIVSQQYYSFVAWKFAYYYGFDNDDVLFTVMPMFHVNAQCVTLLAGVMSGARVAMHGHFSASTFWQRIFDTGATHFAAMGAMGNILLRRPPEEFRPGHRLRSCQIVPAPDPLEDFETRFGVRVMHEVYGMTEGSFLLPNHRPNSASGRLGRNDDYYEVRVVDEDDEECPRGVPGELVVRPRIPGIMFSGYLGNPEASWNAVRNLWFHTGDLGMHDVQGEYWYLGRLKDVIRRRGENIAAFEIEREMLQLEGVTEVAAVGVPSDLGEDDVMVVVAAKAVDEVSCLAWCRERLPAHMVPRYIELCDALPKNASHRVLKRELRERGLTSRTWDALAMSRKEKT